MSWDYSVFDLSMWKLTLPLDDDYFDGNGDGDFTDDEAAQIDQDDLEGLEVSDVFYYDTTTAAMIFHADVDGATTSGSNYTRCELRELDVDGKNASWSVDDTYAHTLSATLYVSDVADYENGDTGRVIIGQIHGSGDELCRLYYNDDGTIYFANEQTGTDGDEERFYFENANGENPDISLDETFSYIIQVDDGELNVAIYADGDTYEAVATVVTDEDTGTDETIDPTEITDDWDGDSFYFKAGVFNQVTADTTDDKYGTGSSEAGFYDIDINDTVSAGDSAWLGDSIDDDGDSTQSGTSGDDTLGGTSSADSLVGGAGDDILYCYGGDDTAWGNAGNDTIYAGTGNDELHGGNGADLYILSDPDGTVTIADFSTSDGDLIDLEDVFEDADGFAEATAWDNGYITLSQSGDDTYVYADLDGSAGSEDSTLVAILTDVDITALSTSDFLLSS